MEKEKEKEVCLACGQSIVTIAGNGFGAEAKKKCGCNQKEISSIGFGVK